MVKMSSAEIKALLLTELQASPEYSIFTDLKTFVTQSITNPGIQLTVVYTFANGPITEESINVLKMIIYSEWGLTLYINETYILIDMIKFLE
jgi:hypothetical protein